MIEVLHWGSWLNRSRVGPTTQQRVLLCATLSDCSSYSVRLYSKQDWKTEGKHTDSKENRRRAPRRKPTVSLVEKERMKTMKDKILKKVCTGFSATRSADQVFFFPLWDRAHSWVWPWSVTNVKSAAGGASPSLVQDSADIKGTASTLLRAQRYCWHEQQIRTWRKFITDAQQNFAT